MCTSQAAPCGVRRRLHFVRTPYRPFTATRIFARAFSSLCPLGSRRVSAHECNNCSAHGILKDVWNDLPCPSYFRHCWHTGFDAPPIATAAPPKEGFGATDRGANLCPQSVVIIGARHASREREHVQFRGESGIPRGDTEQGVNGRAQRGVVRWG